MVARLKLTGIDGRAPTHAHAQTYSYTHDYQAGTRQVHTEHAQGAT